MAAAGPGADDSHSHGGLAGQKPDGRGDTESSPGGRQGSQGPLAKVANLGVAQGGGPAGIGFSHVEDLLTAVTPDCLLHLSALTRPRAQDEGSKGAPLRIFADLVERRTDVSQNAQIRGSCSGGSSGW